MIKLIHAVQTYGHDVFVTIAFGMFLYAASGGIYSYCTGQPVKLNFTSLLVFIAMAGFLRWYVPEKQDDK